MHHIYVLLLKNSSWDLSDFASFILISLSTQFISILCPIQNLKIWIWGETLHTYSNTWNVVPFKKNMNFRSKCKHVAFHPFKFTMHVFKVTSEKGEFSSVSLEQRNRDSKWIAKFNKNTKEYEQIGISNFFTYV